MRSRSDGIRTHDLCVPNAALCQAEPHPGVVRRFTVARGLPPPQSGSGGGADVGRRRHPLLVRLVGQQGRRRLAQAERVDGLDDPAVGLGPVGQEGVDVAVEQHQDLGVVEAADRLVEAQVHAGRHAAHVADLQVQDHQIERAGVHRRQHVDALADPEDLDVVAREGGIDLLVDPVGIGGEQHAWHGATLAPGRPSSPLAEVPGQAAGNRFQGYDVGGHGYHQVSPLNTNGRSCVLEIEVDHSDSHTLCRPVGELDAYTVASFRDALGELAHQPRVVIDLSDVPFMDSAGLGALIGGIRRAREHGGEVAVACSRPTLTRLLHTTGFDRIVPVTDTLDAAVAAVASPVS